MAQKTPRPGSELFAAHKFREATPQQKAVQIIEPVERLKERRIERPPRRALPEGDIGVEVVGRQGAHRRA